MHGNARPHTAAHTAETLRKLKFDVMAHPPYSPDLAPSDYHLFGPLKEALRGRRFTSDRCVRGSLLSRKPSFLRASGSLCNDGPSVEKQGDYVEK
jgi:histone-lysine N-methyltransferase SETMAR